jgi:hypothetical protein
VIKHNFDQTPILLENFDQVIRSSEIQSSDPLSKVYVLKCLFFVFLITFLIVFYLCKYRLIVEII